MEKSDKQEQNKNQLTDIEISNVPFALGEIKENTIITTNTASKPSKQEIIKLASKFHSQGNISEAAKFYQHFINLGFLDHRVFSNYGVILKNLGKLQEAESSLRKAIQINPNFADAHYNLGGILIDLGNLKEAEVSTRKAIQINPNLAEAHYNLGDILIDFDKSQEAEVSTRKAIQINPNFAEAHYNLGLILKDFGNLKEAELSVRKAIELKPTWPKPYQTLGSILLHKGSHELSLKCFSESTELLRGQKNKESNHQRFTTISKAKIKHDIEQLEYLASQGNKTIKFTSIAHIYKNIATEIKWPSETQLIALSNHHQNILKDFYNRLINKLDAPKLKEEAVNNSLNAEEITQNYYDHDYGLTYFDNFLSPLALESLRKFLLESTIWFDIKSTGWIGAYLGEGLANPLILQIADELSKKFPKIFKDYPIKQIWAYKYDSRAKEEDSSLTGIHVHADPAAVNVNFWITRNEANLNPDSGGIIVHDVEAPKDWSHKNYNSDVKKIREEIKRSQTKSTVIPYKENRAVVFNSDLFHETDKYEFKEGYENRRINVTILFGDRRNA